MFMSPEQGSETALWALTNEKVAQEPEKYQGCYIRQADDSVSMRVCQESTAIDESAFSLKQNPIKRKTKCWH